MRVEEPNIRMIADVVTTSEATIARIVLNVDTFSDVFEWTGTSKKMPGDRFSPEVGVKLALSRAMQKAARQLERQANGTVACVEHNRIASKAAKARNATRPVVKKGSKKMAANKKN